MRFIQLAMASLLALGVSLLVSAGVVPGAKSNPGQNARDGQTAEAKNMIEAAKSVIESLGTGDVSSIREYVHADKYIQHNPMVPSGRDALIGFAKTLKDGETKVVRAFVDGEFVVLHVHYRFGPKNPIKGEFAAFDIFRFEDGKIVEHWDNMQPIPERTVSGRSLLDGPKEIADFDKTVANKTLVNGLVDEVLVGGNFSRLVHFISAEQYDQHNPSIGDGLDGLAKAVEFMKKNNIAMRYGKVHKVFGQGNFVLVISEGEFAGKGVAFYDMWRVKDGKLVEHWDVLEDLRPADNAQNRNGKFF